MGKKMILGWLVATLLATATYWLLTCPDERNLLRAFLFGAFISAVGIGIGWYQRRPKKEK